MLVVFWASVGLVFAAFAGYPLWVFVRSRIAPRAVSLPVTADEDLPEVTCVIAACNEGALIGRKLRAVMGQDYPPHKLRVVVVSDSSTDDTDAIVSAWAAGDARVRLLRTADRKGKAAALALARAEIATPLTAFMDVRQDLTPTAIRDLVRHLHDASVGLVSGDLRVRGDSYWTYEGLVRKAESRSGSMVQVTGSLYAIRTRDIPIIPSDIILDDVFVPITILMSRRRIVMAEQAGSLDVVTRTASGEFVRKVRTLSGLVQICHRVPGALLPWRNPAWGRFVMHKLSRLACPYGLVAAFLSSWFIPGSVYRFGAWAAVGAFALALGAHFGVRTRIGALVRSFVVLNAAAFVAVPAWYLGWTSVRWARVETDRS